VVARTLICHLSNSDNIFVFVILSPEGLLRTFWGTGLVMHFVLWKLLKQLLKKPQMK